VSYPFAAMNLFARLKSLINLEEVLDFIEFINRNIS
jgi:hypothetical protein